MSTSANHLPSPSSTQSTADMTTRYTNEEWIPIIAETEKSVLSSVNASKKYPAADIGSEAFTQTVDHTLLKLDAKKPQFDELCAEAKKNRFATVCVRVPHVQQCVSDLKGSNVKVACVVGFHEGTYDLSSKVQEAKQAISVGASELDVVLNWPQLQSQQYATIYSELTSLRSSAPPPTLLKLIFETSQLSPSQIIAACTLASAANFDYVKTSTGFNGPGAKEEHVRLMKVCSEYLAMRNRNREMKVKASGGIRTLVDAVTMLEAGASRLGTSGGVEIAKEAREKVAGGGGEDRPDVQTKLSTDY